VVAHYAAEIEKRLLCAQSTEHLVLRLQITPALLDTPVAALVGITGDGRIDWLNGAAARLLGLTAPLGQRDTRGGSRTAWACRSRRSPQCPRAAGRNRCVCRTA
jgi:transcriptional regulator of acetoin/glycerol metabolism